MGKSSNEMVGFPVPCLTARGTFTNVWFCFFFPVATRIDQSDLLGTRGSAGCSWDRGIHLTFLPGMDDNGCNDPPCHHALFSYRKASTWFLYGLSPIYSSPCWLNSPTHCKLSCFREAVLMSKTWKMLSHLKSFRANMGFRKVILTMRGCENQYPYGWFNNH